MDFKTHKFKKKLFKINHFSEENLNLLIVKFLPKRFNRTKAFNILSYLLTIYLLFTDGIKNQIEIVTLWPSQGLTLPHRPASCGSLQRQRRRNGGRQTNWFNFNFYFGPPHPQTTSPPKDIASSFGPINPPCQWHLRSLLCFTLRPPLHLASWRDAFPFFLFSLPLLLPSTLLVCFLPRPLPAPASLPSRGEEQGRRINSSWHSFRRRRKFSNLPLEQKN